MKAMILAAGRGERMRPLTDTTAKPLLEVNGKALIQYHVEALVSAGFDRIVVNLSWHGDQIRDFLGDGSAFGAVIEYSEEPEALETAGGIRQALDLLGNRFVVVNADILTDYDFGCLRDVRDPAHLVLVRNPSHNPQGDFGLLRSRVLNDGDPRYTFSGIGIYTRAFFVDLVPGKQPLAPMPRRARRRTLRGPLVRRRHARTAGGAEHGGLRPALRIESRFSTSRHQGKSLS